MKSLVLTFVLLLGFSATAEASDLSRYFRRQQHHNFHHYQQREHHNFHRYQRHDYHHRYNYYRYDHHRLHYDPYYHTFSWYF